MSAFQIIVIVLLVLIVASARMAVKHLFWIRQALENRDRS